MFTYLVIGNQTLESRELAKQLTDLAAAEQCRFHLVVPQTPLDHYQLVVDGQAQTVAEHQLSEALADLRELGLEVTGEVGDEQPLVAAQAAAERLQPDAVVVSTFPPGMSRWLSGTDLPSKIGRKLDLPVTHVIGRTYDEARREAHRYAEVRRQLGLAEA